MTATVVIPFHRNLAQLAKSLPAVRRSLPDAEVIVVADAAPEDCREVAEQWDARVLELAERSGPAVARNRGAAAARGDVLIFVDADVVVAPDALRGMCELLAREPQIAGVFGAYDDSPAEPNFMSQYKNLSHAYVHWTGRPDASTFWAGLGAVRADVFQAAGGFDERFRAPSVEDIELGYRLTRAGSRLRLDSSFRGCHLKRWTLANSIVTDVRARGIPWVQLMRKYRAPANDLNVRAGLRVSVALACMLVLSVAALAVTRWAALGVLGSAAALAILNLPYYRWFAEKRGVTFAARVFPVHVVHHLCNGLSFAVGTPLFIASRAGIVLPGAVPSGVWTHADGVRRVGTVTETAR